jgi:hypothetical protein
MTNATLPQLGRRADAMRHASHTDSRTDSTTECAESVQRPSDGASFTQERQSPPVGGLCGLAETDGFEPSMQVFARMLP